MLGHQVNSENCFELMSYFDYREKWTLPEKVPLGCCPSLHGLFSKQDADNAYANKENVDTENNELL